VVLDLAGGSEMGLIIFSGRLRLLLGGLVGLAVVGDWVGWDVGGGSGVVGFGVSAGMVSSVGDEVGAWVGARVGDDVTGEDSGEDVGNGVAGEDSGEEVGDGVTGEDSGEEVRGDEVGEDVGKGVTGDNDVGDKVGVIGEGVKGAIIIGTVDLAGVLGILIPTVAGGVSAAIIVGSSITISTIKSLSLLVRIFVHDINSNCDSINRNNMCFVRDLSIQFIL